MPEEMLSGCVGPDQGVEPKEREFSGWLIRGSVLDA